MGRPTAQQAQALASLFSADPVGPTAQEAADAEARERVRLACESAGLDGIMSYEDIEEMTRPEPVVVDEEEEEAPPPKPAPKRKAPAPPSRAPVPVKLPIAKSSKARAIANHRNRGGGASSSSSAAAPSMMRTTQRAEILNSLLGRSAIDVRSYAKTLMAAMRNPGARVAFAAAARPRIDPLD